MDFEDGRSMQYSSSEPETEDDDFLMRIDDGDSADGDDESLDDEVSSPAVKRPILQEKKHRAKKKVLIKRSVEAYGSIPLSDRQNDRQNDEHIDGQRNETKKSYRKSTPPSRHNESKTSAEGGGNETTFRKHPGSIPTSKQVESNTGGEELACSPINGSKTTFKSQRGGTPSSKHNESNTKAKGGGKTTYKKHRGNVPTSRQMEPSTGGETVLLQEQRLHLEPLQRDPTSEQNEKSIEAKELSYGHINGNEASPREHKSSYEKARRNHLRRLSESATRAILKDERPYKLEFDAEMVPCGGYKNYFDRKLNVLIKKHIDLSISDVRKIPSGQLHLVRKTIQDWFVIPWAEWDKKYWRKRLSKGISSARRSVCESVLRARKIGEEPTKPEWMKNDMWFKFLVYMETSQYKNSSTRNKKARADQKQTVKTGRRGYAGTYMYLKEKMQRSPTTDEIANEAHTSKGYGIVPRGVKMLDLEEKSNNGTCAPSSPSFNMKNTCKRVVKPIALHESFQKPVEGQVDVTQSVDDAKSVLQELHKQIESLSAKKKQLEEDMNQKAARKVMRNKEASVGSQGSAIPKFKKQALPSKHVQKKFEENSEVQILDLRNKSIIGHGRIFSLDPKKTCHFQPIGNGNASIAIQNVNPGHLDDQLLYPTTELTTFKDAINSVIIWPLSLLSNISR